MYWVPWIPISENTPKMNLQIANSRELNLGTIQRHVHWRTFSRNMPLNGPTSRDFVQSTGAQGFWCENHMFDVRIWDISFLLHQGSKIHGQGHSRKTAFEFSPFWWGFKPPVWPFSGSSSARLLVKFNFTDPKVLGSWNFFTLWRHHGWHRFGPAGWKPAVWQSWWSLGYC